MPSIKYNFYEDDSEYRKNDPAESNVIDCSFDELTGSLWHVLLFNERGLSNKHYQRMYDFSKSLLNIALEHDTAEYKRGICYDQAESSVKVAISFLMGMVAAKEVAWHEYRVPILFHLNDRRIHCTPNIKRSGRKHPDFFGIGANGEGHLFEAKGVANGRPPKGTVASAIEQLCAIKTVNASGVPGNMFPTYAFNIRGASDKKDSGNAKLMHVVASGFRGSNWTIDDIDPVSEGRIRLAFDFDSAVLRYYSAAVGAIDAILDGDDPGKGDYVAAQCDRFSIELDRRIYKLVKGWRETFSRGGDILTGDDWSIRLDRIPEEGINMTDVWGETLWISKRTGEVLCDLGGRILDVATEGRNQRDDLPRLSVSGGFNDIVGSALNSMPSGLHVDAQFEGEDGQDKIDSLEDLARHVDWSRVEAKIGPAKFRRNLAEMRLNDRKHSYVAIDDCVRVYDQATYGGLHKEWMGIVERAGLAAREGQVPREGATELFSAVCNFVNNNFVNDPDFRDGIRMKPRSD